MFLAKHKEYIIGYLGLYVGKTANVVTQIGIENSFDSKEIGNHLLIEAMLYCREHSKVTEIQTNCPANNSAYYNFLVENAFTLSDVSDKNICTFKHDLHQDLLPNNSK